MLSRFFQQQNISSLFKSSKNQQNALKDLNALTLPPQQINEVEWDVSNEEMGK